MGIDGILQEGFITTTADKLINYVRTGSMWPMTFGLACCAIEMIHTGAHVTTWTVSGSFSAPARARQM